MSDSGKTFLSTNDLAKQLDLAPITLHRWRVTGEGPPFCKIGSRVVYDPDDVSAWMASRTVRNTAEARALAGT